MGAVGTGREAANRTNWGRRSGRGGQRRLRVALRFCPENQKDGVPFLAWEGTAQRGEGYGEREVHLGHIELEA